MALNEFLPALIRLSKSDKLKAMHFLVSELEKEDNPTTDHTKINLNATRTMLSHTRQLFMMWESEDVTISQEEITERQKEGDILLSEVDKSRVHAHVESSSELDAV